MALFKMCPEQRTNEFVGTLDLVIEPEPYARENVDYNLATVTSAELAIGKARAAVTPYSDYFEVNRANFIEVNGEPLIVIDMKPVSLTAFNQYGGYVPAFFTLDPTNESAIPVPYHIPMSIVPGLEAALGFNFPFVVGNDLERRIANEVLLPNGLEALGLDSLELDENMQPRYTALLVKPMMGTIGYQAVAFLIVDPTVAAQEAYQQDPVNNPWYQVIEFDYSEREILDEEIPVEYRDTPEEMAAYRRDNGDGAYVYDLSEIPAWVNNIFPQEYFDYWIKKWGEFEYHTLCEWQGGDLKRFFIDGWEHVFEADGHAIYQYSITSANGDTSSTHMLFPDPSTGHIHGYTTLNSVEGNNSIEATQSVSYPNFSFVREKFENRSLPQIVQATEIELTYWNGEPVFTAVLQRISYSEENTVDEATYMGYGVVRAVDAAAGLDDRFFIGNNRAEAVQQFLNASSSGFGTNVDQNETGVDIVVVGTITHVGRVYTDFTGSRISFRILGDDGLEYRFNTIANTLTSDLEVGERVTVHANDLQSSWYSVATEVHVEGLIAPLEVGGQ